MNRPTLFDYQKDRDQSGPKKMLADFRSIIQTDGFAVYDSLFGNHPDIHLTLCMAHARRKFKDDVKDDEVKANYVLEEIQKLYLLEAKMREESIDWQQRTVLIKEHAKPVLENLGKWLEEKHYSYRPKSPMGQAIA
ncbi:transposase [Belliella kenyensis]|uniref:Transposase n=1 Tax=Belliella kenyensis TaxID=1472724 RepID=A0ABV8EN62_9BACT|nr:IS66 family transposase [Belliella kenyensis]MCH7400835.1 IS66 family transposase [Belliella kenyensis]MDN3601877.1 transposase [Belliella kenyensis]